MTFDEYCWLLDKSTAAHFLRQEKAFKAFKAAENESIKQHEIERKKLRKEYEKHKEQTP